jgi:hypothetical protein
MSRIAQIKNTYTNQAGVPEIHFTDDLGIDYTLAFELDWILNYFDGHPMGGLSEVAQSNLESFLKYGGAIDPYFARYVNADFMMWRAVLELENAN